MARKDAAPAACSSVIVGARSAARALARFVMASEAAAEYGLGREVRQCWRDNNFQRLRSDMAHWVLPS